MQDTLVAGYQDAAGVYPAGRHDPVGINLKVGGGETEFAPAPVAPGNPAGVARQTSQRFHGPLKVG